MSDDWLVEHHRGSASELHALVPDHRRRTIWILEPIGPAIVLGSTQSADAVDHESAARRGVEVARRRSGGGAVWVTPDDPVWVDIVVPRNDVRWSDDVGHAFLPIGRAWQSALATLGIEGTAVHEGAMVRTSWSDQVCFAGRGPGEVFLGEGKIVGMSQRRTRGGARFQCAVPRRWDPEPLRVLLRETPPADALAGIGAGIGDIDTGALVGALVDALSARP